MPLKHTGKTPKQMLQGLRQAFNVIPVVVGNDAVNFFQESFRNQGFDGKAWKQRKPGSKRNQGRAILTDRGHLKRGIKKKVGPGLYVRTFVSGPAVAYADVHNFGFIGGVTVTAHHRRKYGKTKVYDIKTKRGRSIKALKSRGQVQSFTRRMKMPKRQFMGKSAQLNKRIDAIIITQLTKALK